MNLQEQISADECRICKHRNPILVWEVLVSVCSQTRIEESRLSGPQLHASQVCVESYNARSHQLNCLMTTLAEMPTGPKHLRKNQETIQSQTSSINFNSNILSVDWTVNNARRITEDRLALISFIHYKATPEPRKYCLLSPEENGPRKMVSEIDCKLTQLIGTRNNYHSCQKKMFTFHKE